MKQKWIAHYSLLTLLVSLGGLSAVEPDWYRQSTKTSFMLQTESSPPVGRYEASGIVLRIDPYYLNPRGTRVEVTFSPGTVLEDLILEVSNNATVTFNNCLLRRVAIRTGLRGTVNLQSCVLDDCHVPALEGRRYRRANGNYFTLEEAYAEIGVPKLEMTDCVLAGSSFASPYLSGLTAKRCTFLSCAVDATPEDGKLDTSRFVHCLFNGSKFSSADALLITSECRFSDCECMDVLSTTAGNYLAKPVLVRLIWEKGRPELPTVTATGKVQFETMTTPVETGTALAHRWDGTQLTLTTPMAAESAERVPLKQSLELIDSTTYYANNNGSAPPSRPPPGGSLSTVPVSGGSAITGIPAPAGVSFKSRLNHMNGLLISQLASGGEAGQVTRLNLTALPSLGESSSTLKFNQDVGESMKKALNEVSKFSQLRHNGWPVGHAMEIGFEDKYIPKDGPSAAVACALLLEAAITGKKWDPAFAVTGDMNADGSVQPIGGVQAKIRGATKGSCKIVGVPVKNEKGVADILVLDGPGPLVGITVFGISTFDDALLLADAERPQALQNALTDFDNMRTVMLRDPRQMVPLLRSPHAIQRLQTLLKAAPNCYSAKYLLLYVQGRGPRALSIGGSIEAAQNSAQSIVSAIDHDVDSNMSSLKGDELGSSLNKLRNLRPLLDQRVWPYVDNLVAYGEVIRGSVLNPVRSGARYVDLVSKANKAAGGAKAAYEKLLSDVQVREELGL